MYDLFELPSEQFAKRFAKAGAYEESKHPRDESGRWTEGAGGGSSTGKKPKGRFRQLAGHLGTVGGALAAGAVGIPLAVGGGIRLTHGGPLNNFAGSPVGRAARAVGRGAFRAGVRGRVGLANAAQSAVRHGAPAGISAVNRAARIVGSSYRIR